MGTMTFKGTGSEIAAYTICAAAMLYVIGCSRPPAPLAPVADMSWPLSFEHDGTRWTKAAHATHEDQRRLAEFALRNPALFDNPLVRGDPVVYVTGAGARRLYWGRPAVGGVEWVYIEFKKGGTHTGAGLGQPFMETTE